MKKILYGAMAICLLSPALSIAAGADYDTLSEMAATVTASDFIPIFDASEADGSRMKKLSFDGTATNCLTGLGTFVAFVGAESDPNALLSAGTDNVKDTHIDWGSGAGQVSADDIPPATVQTSSTADSGDGNAASGTITPTAGKLLINTYHTCNDADGCNITMSETGAVDGAMVVIFAGSDNNLVFADSAGVQEMNGTIALANQYENVKLVYRSDRWVQVGQPAVQQISLSSIQLGAGKVSGSALITTDADGINLTDAYCGSSILMTGAGEVGLPDCSATTLGCFIEVRVRDAAEQVQVVDFGDTTNDYFVLYDKTVTDANDEVDMPVAGGEKATFTCEEANKWVIDSYKGTAPTGGGPAD